MEVIVFHGRVKPDKVVKIIVDGESISAKKTMKYLGVVLDSRLSFKEHFAYTEEKTTKVVRALGRLMPNLKGPREAKRRLFANVIMSILTYGAPV